MRRPIRRRARAWELLLAGAIMFALIWASSGPSRASESDKILYEGYYGSERYKASEDALGRIEGWTEDERIRMRVIRKNEYTEYKGWIGSRRVEGRVSQDGNHTYNPNPDFWWPEADGSLGTADKQ